MILLRPDNPTLEQEIDYLNQRIAELIRKNDNMAWIFIEIGVNPDRPDHIAQAKELCKVIK